MKKEQLIDSSAIPRLAAAVIQQLGDGWENTLSDVAEHGCAAAGYPGFTRYSDTVRFFEANQEDIRELIDDMAQQAGQSPYDYVRGFRCLDSDTETEREVGRALYGLLKPEDCWVANVLAWFALEQLAWEYDAMLYDANCSAYPDIYYIAEPQI